MHITLRDLPVDTSADMPTPCITTDKPGVWPAGLPGHESVAGCMPLAPPLASTPTPSPAVYTPPATPEGGSCIGPADICNSTTGVCVPPGYAGIWQSGRCIPGSWLPTTPPIVVQAVPQAPAPLVTVLPPQPQQQPIYLTAPAPPPPDNRPIYIALAGLAALFLMTRNS